MARTRKLAWFLGGATFVVASVGLALLVWDWSTPVPSGSFGIPGFDGLWAVGFGCVGAVLAWRRPEHPVGWVFAAAGVLAAVDFASFEYALAAVVGHRGLPAGDYVGWLQTWVWVPFVALITVYLFLLFPTGRLPGPRWRSVGWVASGSGFLVIAGLAVFPGRVTNLTALQNPFGIAPVWLSGAVTVFGLAGLLSCVLLAARSLFRRSRHGSAIERMQIKWLAYSGCLVVLTLVPSTILSQSNSVAASLAEGALMVAVLTIPVAVGVAILRYRLYEIDRLVSRSVSYAIVTGLLVGVYVGVILTAGLLPFSSSFSVAVSTLAVAALFNPVRHRVQLGVDRRFNRARYNSTHILEAFNSRVQETVDYDAVCADLIDVVIRTVQPATASLWLPAEAELQPSAWR